VNNLLVTVEVQVPLLSVPVWISSYTDVGRPLRTISLFNCLSRANIVMLNILEKDTRTGHPPHNN